MAPAATIAKKMIDDGEFGQCIIFSAPTIQWLGLTTLDVHNFAFEDHEVTELIGLELARLIVDTCYPELLREREETERVIERQSRKSPY